MQTKTKVTIQVIADEVGLSKYAVSRSLAGKSGVSEETRRRISKVAERLGYTKSVTRNRASDTEEIAVVFYDIDPVNSELNVQIQTGVQQEAERLGVGIRIRWTHSDLALEELSANFAGLILVGPHTPEAIARAAAGGATIVRLGWTDPLQQIDSVSGSDHEAGQAVARYLTSLGHRSIAYVYGLPIYRGRHERYYGMREILEQNSEFQLHVMQFEEQSGFATALGELQERGVHPTAFFCAHDGLAVTVVSELLGQGFRIPDDVSVVGFGDFSAAMQISPALTTVRQEGRETGAAALQLLLDRIRRPRLPDQPPRSIRVVSRIVERRSAGPVKS
ncbi:LacI family DNA-binding transcriptional regulator [Rhizobium grahamii]|uniref:LacI family transcriptional regulator n=2 Tax=Rhizobium grahamii TaxID=1120045 RepID=S3HD71_9HYPH|nr:LacI family DNA-binding transcriptional regulator [Rhizobium grahamii]EPE96722.1 LacI family transcriptional regulator [Rhizobium grahamii CCGE 502]RDJ03946.1 LacI family transcriptional regulator [Rhizobium grahamii]